MYSTQENVSHTWQNGFLFYVLIFAVIMIYTFYKCTDVIAH